MHVQLLLANNASPNKVDDSRGDAYCCVAAISGNDALVQALLNYGTSLNKKLHKHRCTQQR